MEEKRIKTNGNCVVLHIVEAFGGGVFSFLSDLISSMDKSINHIIVYAKRPETPENFQDYFPKNTIFIESKYLQREINLKTDIKAIKEIKQIIKTQNPNVIHLHSSKAGVIGRLASIGKDHKVFYNPHGFSFLMKNTSRLKRKVYFLIEKLMTIMPCTIIACSKGEYEEAKKLTKHCVNINNGLSIEKIKKDTQYLKYHKANTTRPTICTIGRIDHQKSPSLFNEIAKQNPNLSFIWIGNGALKSELSAKNITVTGWLGRNEVLKILNNSDIFILTSLYEGLPISLLEAMFLKKLCIVSNTVGNNSVIKDNINGYIANNASDYTSAIKNVSSSTFSIIANNAQVDVLNNYNLTKIANEYQEIYN